MNLYVVRAKSGEYTNHFVNGGYIGIGWLKEKDLTEIKTLDQLYVLFTNTFPPDTSRILIGNNVGQVARFLFEIKAGDYVITPALDTEYIYYGVVKDDTYNYSDGKDGCWFPHRRKVEWVKQPILRSQFNVPFQNSIRSTLTVFRVQHLKNFLETIGRGTEVPESLRLNEADYYTVVLNRILELDNKEFEILITDLLSAVGFEGSEHTGKSGDGGVDATGELNIANMAKVKVFVQAKRYKLGVKIAAGVVKALRQSIPFGGQGAFITTCDYQDSAKEVALEPGFPRIGLVNGHQLVDLLVEHWDDITQEFKEKLGLKKGLVLA